METGSSQIPITGMAALRHAYGNYGANLSYALAARRHMHRFGTTSEQLGAIAVSQRKWAQMNPRAQMRKPLTLEEHQNSRFIAEPLHLFDCCLVSNGAVAVILTSAERAKTLKQTPVYVLGLGQGSLGDNQRTDREPGIYTGARMSGERALRMAGIELKDIDICELYDCYTYTVLVTLEDYGFCAKGEGERLSRMANWGRVALCPPIRAVVSCRLTICGALHRFLRRWCRLLGSGNGGVLNYHATTNLSKHAA